MSKTIKIEGETNIKNLAGFEHFIEAFGHKSRITTCPINFSSDGTFQIFCFMPHIRKCEIDVFQNNALKFYRKELPDGTITTSMRGMVTTDGIHTPFSSDKPLSEAIIQDSIIEAILIDSATDEIKGYRFVKVPKKIISQIVNDWRAMEYNGVEPSLIPYSMAKYIFPYTPKEIKKRSQYIGRECEDVTPEIVYLIGKDVA